MKYLLDMTEFRSFWSYSIHSNLRFLDFGHINGNIPLGQYNMPFENLKRHADLQKQVRDAEIKHQQWLAQQETQKKIMGKLRLSDEAERKAEWLQKFNRLKECYDASHIGEITDEFVEAISGSKDEYDIYLRGAAGDESTIDHMRLTWHGDETVSNRIDISFLEDNTLAVAGDPDKGTTKLSENKWRGNLKLIEDALEKAYFHPRIQDEYHGGPEPLDLSRITTNG
jgi:hypothetical protein